MQKIKLNITQVSPGMKLAEPITNSTGITLMPAGIRLTPMFIIRLKKWHIESVEVFIDNAHQEKPEHQNEEGSIKALQSSTNLSAEQEAFARFIAEEAACWFINVKGNPLMLKLRNIAIKKLVLHGQDGMLNVMRRGRMVKRKDDS